jgi:rSAM/selenodomain-associated transferase 1
VSKPQKQFGVFAKYWQPGSVKTRLAVTEGVTVAAKLYTEFLLVTLRRFAAAGEQRVLGFTPAVYEEEFRNLAGPEWILQPQRKGDLGERMHQYFQDAFLAGQDQVLLIGADTPHLPLAVVQQAYATLDGAEIVLGSSSDGGYYLIGANRPVPEIFVDIDWGSSRVWEQTIQKLRGLSCSFAELPTWYDIDQRADLDRLLRDLSSPSLVDQHLIRLRDRILELRGLGAE